MTKKILIGKVNSVFGIKGEVKILSFAQDPLKLEKYSLFDEKGNPLKLKISNKNKAVVGTNGFGDPIVIAKIEGVDDRNASEKLRGMEIFADREDFGETSDDEFYYVDLIGLDVVDMESKKIGKVLNVMDHGAGGILEIEFNAANSEKHLEKVENFPFKNELFPEVNLKAGFIRFDLPEIVKIR